MAGDNYHLDEYGSMVAYDGRREAYIAALRAAVKPGDVVVDLGAGAGFFSLVAARLGARRVYAIETNPAIDLGPRLASANGLADRITFIRGDADHVSLPEKADVLLADLRGSSPFHDRNLQTLFRARDRFLRVGGTLIGQRDHLLVTLADLSALRDELSAPWTMKPMGLDLSAGLDVVLRSPSVRHVDAATLLGPGVRWATLDYATRTDPNVRGTASIKTTRRGLATALVLWFDADLGHGVRMAAGPGEGPHPYRQTILPLPEPIVVGEADEVAVRLRADLVDDHHVFGWRLAFPGKPEVEASTLSGAPLSSATLRRASGAHVPRLDDDRRVDAGVLELADGKTSQADIAEHLRAQFPERFADGHAALKYVVAFLRSRDRA